MATRREVVFDVETTGLNPANGDRVVEIGCVELIARAPTGNKLHCYFDPQRPMPSGAFEIHGLSTEFLRGKPLFEDKADEILSFLGDALLVAHNAFFDFDFLNAELKRANRQLIDSARVIDTLAISRSKHPGAKNTLDALCRRYGISTAQRTKHSALLDAELLAMVYRELTQGHKQASFDLISVENAGNIQVVTRQRPMLLAPRLTDEDIAAHRAFVATIKDAVWDDYLTEQRKAA